MKKIGVIGGAAVLLSLAGCQTPGQQYASNVYTAQQVNSRQQVDTVQILAVLPAKVQVSNAENQRAAAIAGGILGAIAGGLVGANVGHYHQTNTALGAVGGGAAGAAAGSLVPGMVLVDGVSITYQENGKTFNSAQVGKPCEFVTGTAVLVSTGPNETRIQPNHTCPVEAQK